LALLKPAGAVVSHRQTSWLWTQSGANAPLQQDIFVACGLEINEYRRIEFEYSMG
jgi:hypothetical protein